MPKNLILFLSIAVVFLGCNGEEISDSRAQRNIIQQFIQEAKRNEIDIGLRMQLIDSAYKLANRLPVDTNTLSVIYTKSNLHYELKQKDSSYFYDGKLLRESEKFQNNYYIGKASQALAYHFKTKNIYDSAFYYYNISKNAFQKLNDSAQVGRRLMAMGQIQQNQNDFVGSKETLTEALKYLDINRNSKYVASCYSSLATNHRKLLNFQDAEKYYYKAIETTASNKDKLTYKNNLAASYIDEKKYNEAISILTELSQDLLAFNNKEYPRVLDNLAYTNWLSGKKANEYAFLRPLQIRKENKDKRGKIASYTHLGEFYTKSAPVKAKQYFDTVIYLSQILKIPRAEKDALRFLMNIELKNIDLRNRYVFLQDSLYAQELKVKTQFAKYKYDDKLKQESILRLEKEYAEKELEASQQRNQKLIFSTIGGLLVVVLCFSSYYYVQRTKRLKKEKETAALQAVHDTEAELSRRLHDDFGGKLNRTMVMLQNNTEQGMILDVVEGLYNQSRDFSREINTVDIGPNFKNEFVEMLRFRTPTSSKLLLTGLNEVDWKSISPINKTTLYKVLQELMINMAKHSNATLVSIEFIGLGKGLKVKYADDGVGASQKELESKNGLLNTEKRIQAISGSITFDTEKTKGFRAEIKVPE
ncbi:MAG: tetratricopeptide repeat protein [Bacteroidota bacterium]